MAAGLCGAEPGGSVLASPGAGVLLGWFGRGVFLGFLTMKLLTLKISCNKFKIDTPNSISFDCYF